MQSFSERIFSLACGLSRAQCSVDWSVNIPLQEPAVYGGGAEPASIMNAAANEFGEMLRHPEWTVDTAGPHLAL